MGKARIFNHRFNDSLEHIFRAASSSGVARAIDFSDIRIDLAEKNGSYKVMADMPGVKKEHIAVRVDGNTVLIDAQENGMKGFRGNGFKFLRNERHQGALSRMLTLPNEVDESKVIARYSDGVLYIDLPKRAISVAQSKVITVE